MKQTTHVLVTNADGASWRCPIPYLPVALRKGWKADEPAEVPADVRPFDPSGHTVEEVNAYLAEHAEDPDEVARVVALEDAGKNRASVTRPPVDA